MQAKWYFAETGKSIGPVTEAQIRERILLAGNSTLFVWTAGMADWAEARSMPELAAHVRPVDGGQNEPAAKRMLPSAAKRAELGRRARHELVEFLTISAYLWVCFGALVIYKAAILRSVGVEFAPFGFAVVKALISAKFIMLLQAFKLGDRAAREEHPFIVILRKALVFTVFLIILTVIEEMLVGHLHGKEGREILAELGGGTVPQALSVGLLIFLIMVPFFAFRETGVSLWKTAGD